MVLYHFWIQFWNTGIYLPNCGTQKWTHWWEQLETQSGYNGKNSDKKWLLKYWQKEISASLRTAKSGMWTRSTSENCSQSLWSAVGNLRTRNILKILKIRAKPRNYNCNLSAKVKNTLKQRGNSLKRLKSVTAVVCISHMYI